MSRFFKSAAFPILIVVVLAFFAQKLIGSSSHSPNYTFGNLIQQMQNGEVKSLTLDQKALAGFPDGYRYLAYLQADAGYTVKLGLPGLRGPEVELLYREGHDWLNGSPRPGVPL